MARLDQLVARNLGLSRRVTTRLFKQKRIRDPHGEVLDPRAPVRPEAGNIEITVDGQPETLVFASHVLLHKPAGVITAMKDARHPVAWELVRDHPLAQELRPVGRLDLDTTGLLLWTTDGDLVHRLTHPRRKTPRRYHVALNGPWSELPPDFAFDDGHVPDVVALDALQPSRRHPALPRPRAATHWAEITLRTGRFHEVKRIFAALGSEVVALTRVSHGPVELPPDLPSGHSIAIDLPTLVDGER